MKKLIAAAALAVAAFGVGASPTLDAGRQEKSTVCHDGDNGMKAISIADPAVEKHIEHGDARPGDEVPGYGGYGATYGEDCQPVPTPAPDADGDGVADADDNCANDANSNQADGDGDGVGDVCDNCPVDANPNQQDSNSVGTGDACSDADGDGVPDADDNCPNQGDQGAGVDSYGCPIPPDSDGDGVPDADDNCPNQGDQGYGLEGDGCPVPPPPPAPPELERTCLTYGGDWGTPVGSANGLYLDTNYICTAPNADFLTFNPLWEAVCRTGNWLSIGYSTFNGGTYSCLLQS